MFTFTLYVSTSTGFNSWVADEGDAFPWIEVSFSDERHVTGVVTQGRDSGTYYEWVTLYNVMYCYVGYTGTSRMYVYNTEGDTQEVSVTLCNCNVV